MKSPNKDPIKQYSSIKNQFAADIEKYYPNLKTCGPYWVLNMERMYQH